MKLQKPEASLLILAGLVASRYVGPVLPEMTTPSGHRLIPATAILQAEQRLARRQCVTSELLSDARIHQLLPIVSQPLSLFFSRNSRFLSSEAPSEDDLQTLLKTVYGIGPKKAARLVQYLCTKENLQ
jgi:hypothetical protein